MAKYVVEVREVHVSHVTVYAETREEAAKAAKCGDGELGNTEYSSTLDENTWAVVDAGKTYYYNEATGKYDKVIG